MPEPEIIIPTSPTSALRVSPLYRHSAVDDWKLASAAVGFAPSLAGQVAAAIGEIAARIDGGPVDPWPSEREREESRMP